MSEKSRQRIFVFLMFDFAFMMIMGLIAIGAGITKNSFLLASHPWPPQIHAQMIIIGIGMWVALSGALGLVVTPIATKRRL